MKTMRALLVLGRVSNLPTIWSNCLCGWLIGAGLSDSFQMDWAMFAWLASGATAMYLGGMVLNDACDVAFDREHRPERPIPSGAISEKSVWYLGIGLLAAGMGLLAIPGGATALLALALFNCILLYNFIHKKNRVVAGADRGVSVVARNIGGVFCVRYHGRKGNFFHARSQRRGGVDGAGFVCVRRQPELFGQGGKRGWTGAILAVRFAGIAGGFGVNGERGRRPKRRAAGRGYFGAVGGSLFAIHLLGQATRHRPHGGRVARGDCFSGSPRRGPRANGISGGVFGPVRASLGRAALGAGDLV